MSDSPTPTPTDILNINELQATIAALQRQVATISALHDNTGIVHDRDNGKKLDPTRDPGLVAAVPSITGAHFFEAPENPDDDVIFRDMAPFPINTSQEYKPPKDFGVAWPDNSSEAQTFERYLIRIQETVAQQTRPLDDFAVEIYQSVTPSDLKNGILDVVHLLRSQQCLLARQITDMRAELFIKAKGLKPAPLEKSATFSTTGIQARIAAAKLLTPTKSNSTQSNNRQRQRGRGGYGNYQYQGQQGGQYQQPQQYQQQFAPQYQRPP